MQSLHSPKFATLSMNLFNISDIMLPNIILKIPLAKMSFTNYTHLETCPLIQKMYSNKAFKSDKIPCNLIFIKYGKNEFSTSLGQRMKK